MQLTSLLYILLLLPLLSSGNPVPHLKSLLPTEEEYKNSTTNRPSKSIFARVPGPAVLDHGDLVKRWFLSRGGAKGTATFIDITYSRYEKEKPEFQINGKWYPLIELDCTNSYPTGKYKGNYYDICRNYLWIRNCDPSTKALIHKTGGIEGYPILHKGAVRSNSLRRKQGGYFDDSDGPCSAKNNGAKTNTFYQKGDGKYSLEEMYMAFMEEGGLSVPDDAQIGETKLLPGVGRSQSFRCVASDENKSSGSRWAGQVKRRGIQSMYSKGSKPPAGSHGDEYPPGAFIISLINYGAVATGDWKYDWELPDSSCKNDGRQFLGLNLPKEKDMEAIMENAVVKNSQLKSPGEQISTPTFATTFPPKRPLKGENRRILSAVKSVGKTITSAMTWKSSTDGRSAQLSPAKGKPILLPPPTIPPKSFPQSFQKGEDYSKVEAPTVSFNEIHSCTDFQRRRGQRGRPNNRTKPNNACETQPKDEGKSKEERPETPAEKLTMVEEPAAPIKPIEQRNFWTSLEPIIFKGWLSQESAWDRLNEDDGATYDFLFPKPENFDEILFPLKNGWQYFPASKTGVVDGKLKDLHRFTSPHGDSPSRYVKGKGKAAERKVGFL